MRTAWVLLLTTGRRMLARVTLGPIFEGRRDSSSSVWSLVTVLEALFNMVEVQDMAKHRPQSLSIVTVGNMHPVRK